MANLGLKNNNPGNLRDPSTGNFRLYNSPQEGKRALIDDLKAKQSGQSAHIKPGASIADLGDVWAPPSDNNVKGDWARNVAKALGVDTAYAFDKVPAEKLAQGIQVAEGTSTMKTGTSNIQTPTQTALTHDQMISNINAMEKQGAKPQEIQGYLDSLKTSQQGQSGLPTGTPSPVEFKPTYQTSQNDTGGSQNGQSDPSTLGGQIASRVDSASQGVNQTAQGVSGLLKGNLGEGAVGVGSGLLHIAGSIAGGIGDVSNKLIEQIPGVKSIENIIGQKVGDYAKTPDGQQIIKSLQSFSKANPKISQGIGDVFNIAMAIPILRGIGVIKDIALSGASRALKGTAEKAFTKEASAVIGKTAKGGDFMRTNPSVATDMINERMIPDIKGGVYDTTEAMNTSDKTLHDLNTQIKTNLKNPKYTNVAENPKDILDKTLNGYTDRNGNVVNAMSNSEYSPEQIIKVGRDLTSQNGRLWSKFEAGQATMDEINTLRSDLDKAVQSVYSSTTLPPIRKEIGSALSGAMRDYVQTNAPETAGDFARMTKVYKIQEGLDFMNKKPVVPGVVGGFIKSTVGKIPVVGGLGEGIANKMAGTTVGVLKRTGQNAAKLTQVGSKIQKGMRASLIQKAGNQ